MLTPVAEMQDERYKVERIRVMQFKICEMVSSMSQTGEFWYCRRRSKNSSHGSGIRFWQRSIEKAGKVVVSRGQLLI